MLYFCYICIIIFQCFINYKGVSLYFITKRSSQYRSGRIIAHPHLEVLQHTPPRGVTAHPHTWELLNTPAGDDTISKCRSS